MKIISKTWCATQACYLYEFICTAAADIAELPVDDIAYGSSCVCGDGKLYFFFPDDSWKPMA